MAEISIIMPAYNAAATISKTVESVLKQTFRDFELWIVDDGSTDGTLAIAQNFAKLDNRVKVVHQSNGKAYSARVNALRRIATPYFAFVDADDTLEPVMYEKLYHFAKEYDLDVAQCDIYGSKASFEPDLYLTRDAVMDKIVMPYLVEGVDSFFVWDKLYRRDLGQGLVDSNIMMFDDMKLNLQFFRKVERFGLLHEGLYHYNINAGSSVRNFRLSNLYDLAEINDTRRDLLQYYGVPRGDVVHDRWLVLNARNTLISAAHAFAPTWETRVSNVRSVLDFPDMIDAAERLCAARDKMALRMKIISHLPAFLVALFYHTLKTAQDIVRHYIKKN